MDRTHLVVLLTLCALVLAGCTTPEDAPPGPDGPTPSTAATGRVAGDVARLDLERLAGASVFLVAGDLLRETTTDATGRYTFDDVAPGRYRVQVAALGHETGVAPVDVAAGATAQVSFLLEPLVVEDPFHETLEFEGFFECAFGTIFITDTCTFVWRTAYDAAEDETGTTPPIPRDPGNNANTFPWTIGAKADAVVSEMVWEDPSGTTETMMMLLSSTPIDNACDCSEHDHIEVTGPSPLRAIVGRDLPDIYGDDLVVAESGPLWSALDTAPNGTIQVASRGFLPFDTSVGYSHAFTLYVTTFYDSVPEPGFTAIPEA